MQVRTYTYPTVVVLEQVYNVEESPEMIAASSDRISLLWSLVPLYPLESDSALVLACLEECEDL